MNNQVQSLQVLKHTMVYLCVRNITVSTPNPIPTYSPRSTSRITTDTAVTIQIACTSLKLLQGQTQETHNLGQNICHILRPVHNGPNIYNDTYSLSWKSGPISIAFIKNRPMVPRIMERNVDSVMVSIEWLNFRKDSIKYVKNCNYA